MTALKHAMSDYVNEIVAGPAPRTDELRRRLREVQAQNTRYFVAPTAMLAVTFIVAMGLIVYGACGTTTTAVIASVFGISVVGMIRMMLGFWREKVATELIIELSELDEIAFRKVIARLLARMK